MAKGSNVVIVASKWRKGVVNAERKGKHKEKGEHIGKPKTAHHSLLSVVPESRIPLRYHSDFVCVRAVPIVPTPWGR